MRETFHEDQAVVVVLDNLQLHNGDDFENAVEEHFMLNPVILLKT